MIKFLVKGRYKGRVITFYKLVAYRAAERTRGARGKILFGAPMTSLFSNKTKNRWTVLQSVKNTHERDL